jgi:hypothetical protein
MDDFLAKRWDMIAAQQHGSINKHSCGQQEALAKKGAITLE